MKSRKQELDQAAVLFAKHAAELHDELTKIGYQLLSPQQSLQIFFDEGLSRPDRADAGNVIQRQYQYVSKKGYTVIVHTGIIDTTFTKPMKWVMILGKKDSKDPKAKPPKLFVKRFKKDDPDKLIPKLIAYGYLAKAIADSRPTGAELVPMGNAHVWRYVDEKIQPFFVKSYLKEIPKQYVKILRTKERFDRKYLKETQHLVDVGKMKRLPEIRKTWK